VCEGIPPAELAVGETGRTTPNEKGLPTVPWHPVFIFKFTEPSPLQDSESSGVRQKGDLLALLGLPTCVLSV
jgi:hypothetical protein